MKIITLVLLFVCSSSFAQYTAYRDPNPSNHRMMPMNFDTPFDNLNGSNWGRSNKVYNITGTPYVADDYTEGSTTIFNKKGFTAPMRYNAAKDVIEFLDDDKKTKELLRRPYITATFGEKTYEVISYMNDSKERLAYFNVLNKGKTQLMFKPKKNIKVSTQRFQGKIQARYKDASMYYIKKGAQPAEMVPLENKELLLQLSDQKVALSKFITAYKLNLKNEADAIRLIEYYNSLLSPQPFGKKAQS